MESEPKQEPRKSSLRRAITVGMVVFAVLLTGLALLAWLGGDAFLSMEYEGFD